MDSLVKLSPLLTLGDLLRVVATGHERTALVIDDEGRLYGVVSQGDLLKAIWNGNSLSDPAEAIINPNPLFVVDAIQQDELALDYFVKHGALLVPVVDKNRKLLRVIHVRDAVQDLISQPKYKSQT